MALNVGVCLLSEIFGANKNQSSNLSPGVFVVALKSRVALSALFVLCPDTQHLSLSFVT